MRHRDPGAAGPECLGTSSGLGVLGPPPRGAGRSVKLEGGEAEPAQHAQVAQVAVAQPVGKGQLVPIWQLHLELVTLKGHGELRWEGGRQRGRRPPGKGPWRCPAAPTVPARVPTGVPYQLGSPFDVVLGPLFSLTSP